MATIFETFGQDVMGTLTGIAEQTSTLLINNLQLPVMTALTIYFLLKGYLILAGRIQEPVVDFVLTAAKIAIITFIGFQTFSYVNYVIPFVKAFEELLVSSLSIPSAGGTVTNAWSVIDRIWSSIYDAQDQLIFIMGQLGWSGAVQILFLGLAYVAIFLCMIFLTSAAIGVLLINEISLTLVLSFGPLFICLLFFPITRSWFDGWIKSVVTYVFIVVIMTAVLMLIVNFFYLQVDDITRAINRYGVDQPMSLVLWPCAKFLVIAIVSTTLVKMVPAIAAGITGGTALQAVGIGHMMNSAYSSGRQALGATVAGIGMATGAKGVANAGRSMLGGSPFSSGGSAALASAGMAAGAVGLGVTALTAATAPHVTRAGHRVAQTLKSAASMAGWQGSGTTSSQGTQSSQGESTSQRAGTDTTVAGTMGATSAGAAGGASSSASNPGTQNFQPGQSARPQNSSPTSAPSTGSTAPHPASNATSAGASAPSASGQTNPGASPVGGANTTATRNMDSATGTTSHGATSQGSPNAGTPGTSTSASTSATNGQQQGQTTATRVNDAGGQPNQGSPSASTMTQSQSTADRVSQQGAPKANETPEESIARMNAATLAKYEEMMKKNKDMK